ncbi:hypothetical protein L0Z65_02290 [Phaeobacter sp. BS52]|uniref:hypothetical protein n=1 Tax=Phaeobacter sp. BS52 TaxID=2907241 RepID=UPI003866E2E3
MLPALPVAATKSKPPEGASWVSWLAYLPITTADTFELISEADKQSFLFLKPPLWMQS